MLTRMRRQPALRIAAALLQRPGLYRGAGGLDPRASSASSPFEPEVILASFHGMPQEYVDKGDPYYDHCVETDAAAARAAQARRKQIDADLPVALRPRQMARARDRPDVKKLAKRGVKISR